MQPPGAAISLIDALYLKINVPDSTVKFYGYGMPRVSWIFMISPSSYPNVVVPPFRSETRSSRISSTAAWITLSASQTSRIRFRSSQEGSWGTATHLGKPTLTMTAAGSSAPPKITPTNNAALVMFLTSSLVTPITTLVLTMVLL